MAVQGESEGEGGRRGEGGEARASLVAKGIHNEKRKRKKNKDDNMCLRFIHARPLLLCLVLLLALLLNAVNAVDAVLDTMRCDVLTCCIVLSREYLYETVCL